MANVEFWKAQATGNDFVLVDDPEGALPLTPSLIASWCDRHFGIGADGFIRAIRSEQLAEGQALLAEDPSAQWFMDYSNADGSIAEMCGNGVRAFAAFLLAQGHASLAPGETLAIGTRAGIKRVALSPSGFSVDLGPWRLSGDDALVGAAGLAVPRPSLGIDVGNPHAVVALPDVESLERLQLHAAPRLDPAPPAGANVEFVVPMEPLVHEGVGHVRMRVYERGVGETLSCGTGIAATALAVRTWVGANAPDRWQVTVAGGTLGVTIVPTEHGEHVVLDGPAELVFQGEVSLTASHPPVVDTPGASAS